MSFTTFSGPVLSGTVKQNAGRNTGLPLLTQSATLAATVALTAAPVAQLLAVLPAGSKILRFRVEKTVAISGGSVSEVALTIGTAGSAALYMASANLGLTAVPTVQATLDAAMVPAQTNNIGTSDVSVYGTFTAATGNPTAGSIVVTIEYIQRADDGSQYPSGTRL
jgi:hypothetical protein